ncbi:MAG: type II toxin-antitoxin system prevent-host-death family antitoxin [Alphaproteobacteria bacterium]|nr:type II toxin-antitoxin system prevent-host-death family antitoxin [Alphaproteobacteria bacterium]
MKSVTVSELKDRLSEFLRHVKQGETVIVTDRKRPIAKIEPLRAAIDDSELQRMAAEGILRLPIERYSSGALPLDPPRAKRSVLEALLEERREGR